MAPGAPTGVSAAAGDTQATVSFTAPSFQGVPPNITGYLATSNPGGFTATGSASPLTVTGLTNGTSYTFTVQATNGVQYGPAGTSGGITPAVPQRAFFNGGTIGVSPDQSDQIDQFTITSTGNAADWGNLTSIQDFGASMSSSTRGVVFKGRKAGFTTTNEIDYFNLSSTGNASDFGDDIVTQNDMVGASNSTRGLAAGGSSVINTIRYVTIASTGNATDFGDMTISRLSLGAVASPTRACFGGGFNDAGAWNYNLDIIDYVTIGSTGNATDFGDLTAGRNGVAASSSSTRGVFFGGNNTNIIDYITIASTGNATDFGDLSSTSWSGGASASGLTRALVGGTSNNAGNVAYVTIASTGNASDFGDLRLEGGTTIKRSLSACSNAHGGLS
jgi:hypothetical protein